MEVVVGTLSGNGMSSDLLPFVEVLESQYQHCGMKTEQEWLISG
jgi:hypothetical protein